MPKPPLRVVLRTGDPLYVRLASRDDRGEVIRFYESLSIESVYMRFLHIVRDFTRYVDLVLGDLNRYGVVLLGYNGGGELVAVSEVFSKEGLVGEIAVTVSENARGKGIGTVMAILAALEAHRRGVRIVEAYISRENSPAIAIAKKLGLELKYVGGDTCKAVAVVEKAYQAALEVLWKRVERIEPAKN